MTDKEIVKAFMSSFKKQEVQGMMSYYSGDIVFFDPLADLLNGKEEVEARWKLFFEDASQCNIEIEDVVDEGDDYYTCKWLANFLHTSSGRYVHLSAKANFKMADGKIAEHSDGFSLHKYCEQVFGIVAKVIGWNSMYQRARKNEFRRRLLQIVQ